MLLASNFTVKVYIYFFRSENIFYTISDFWSHGISIILPGTYKKDIAKNLKKEERKKKEREGKRKKRKREKEGKKKDICLISSYFEEEDKFFQ